MVPTLTILGRFSEAARGAVIPWLETTLVTVAIMAVLRAEVTSIPPVASIHFSPFGQHPSSHPVCQINFFRLGTF